MSIISPRPLQASNVVNLIINNNIALYNYLATNYTFLFNLVWNNSDASPMDIVAGFGTEAAELFEISQMVGELLNTVNPDFALLPVPSQYTYVINEDGSVTVTESEPSS